MDPQKPPIIFKMLFIGNSTSGKSAFIIRYCDNEFRENYLQTIGLDFRINNLELQGKQIKLQLWDTAGDDRMRSLTTTYYYGALGVFIFYDLSNRQSFVDVLKWIEEVEQQSNKTIVKMLVGNKSDLINSREVSFEEGQKLADEKGMHFIETSTQNGNNVKQAVQILTSAILTQIEELEKQKAPEL